MYSTEIEIEANKISTSTGWGGLSVEGKRKQPTVKYKSLRRKKSKIASKQRRRNRK